MQGKSKLDNSKKQIGNLVDRQELDQLVQIPLEIANYLKQVKLPNPDSHKGQNGKLLVIGGSDLFHSSIFWAADVASRIVDMVHFTSPANENNELVRAKIKQGFWTGIVVDWSQVASYIEEDDCVLIGPGMERSAETRSIVNRLLAEFPDKKWVVDGGALQMVDPRLLTKSSVITPHQHELEQVVANFQDQVLIDRHAVPTQSGSASCDQTTFLTKQELDNLALNSTTQTGRRTQSWKIPDPRLLRGRQVRNDDSKVQDKEKEASIDRLTKQGVTVLLKGKVDQIFAKDQHLEITGGNAGMTKGGTGDVLAGLVAALYCQHDSLTASAVASFVNKKAGEELWQSVGPFFNAGELVEQVPKSLWKSLKKT